MSISCWFCDVSPLSDPALFSRGMTLLPWEERRERVMRYRFDKDRRLCLGAGLLLAYALRQAGASNLNLRALPNGKPVLTAIPDIHFNLSHSGILAVCAVSDQQVGVDVEVIQSANPEIGELCFQKQEQEWINQSNDPGRAFTRLWTRKESYLKRLGTGLTDDPKAFSVLPGSMKPDETVFKEHEIMGHMICVCTLPKEVLAFRRSISLLDLL